MSNDQRLFPAFLLGFLGFILAAWNVYLILSSESDSFFSFKGQIVFIVAGLILIGFAVWHVKGKEYSDIEDVQNETLEIEWEFDDPSDEMGETDENDENDEKNSDGNDENPSESDTKQEQKQEGLK